MSMWSVKKKKELFLQVQEAYFDYRHKRVRFLQVLTSFGIQKQLGKYHCSETKQKVFPVPPETTFSVEQ